jgi:hypothetical protein
MACEARCISLQLSATAQIRTLKAKSPGSSPGNATKYSVQNEYVTRCAVSPPKRLESGEIRTRYALQINLQGVSLFCSEGGRADPRLTDQALRMVGPAELQEVGHRDQDARSDAKHSAEFLVHSPASFQHPRLHRGPNCGTSRSKYVRIKSSRQSRRSVPASH